MAIARLFTCRQGRYRSPRIHHLLLADTSVVRPHPLLVTLRRDEAFVIVAPAEVSERARDVLRPFIK